MTAINKQRFLPELGKLLTFMVEEDRQTALAMYSRLFDDAADEQQLMDLLVSPTRQAVVIARTYDAKERKQQLESSKEDETETPAFVLAIDKIYQQVAPKEGVIQGSLEDARDVLENNQFSLFPDDAHPIDDSEYVPFQIEADSVPLEEAVDQLPVEEQPDLPAEPAAGPVPEENPSAPAEGTEVLPEEDAPAEETGEEKAPAGEALAEEPPAGEREEDFRPVDLPEQKPEEAPAAEKQPEPLPKILQDFDPKAAPPQVSAADYDLDYLPETRRKPRVFLLILFTLLAIPVTLIGIVLLLIPTVLALAAAVLVIVLGSATLVAAFSGFPKLADLLIVIGTSVIVLALGLLLLWLFVWFVGGAIGGLIRGIVDLGRKWCYVEVPV